MTADVFNFLARYSSSPSLIDRLIVSSFLKLNGIRKVQNSFLKTYIINGHINYEEGIALEKFVSLIKFAVDDFRFENLIELFEFVVSPSDKVINGAIYTPEFIRNYIVLNLLNSSKKPLKQLICADISCGCGAFLLTIASAINDQTGKSYYDIYNENLYGIDITEYSTTRCKLLLSLYGLLNGEDVDFKFNIEIGNSLNYNWFETHPEISDNKGFDIIAGNPPYVASRNMDDITLSLISEWSVSKTGHPDLYIPFFQIGYEALSPGGSLGYITVNTFMKSINGRGLRSYFSDNRIKLTIINFGGEQVFKGRSTYTCICFLTKVTGLIGYLRTESDNLPDLKSYKFLEFDYNTLNNKDGWNLVNNKMMENFVREVESIGKPFKKAYRTKNGIATLKNDVYKFSPTKEDNHFLYLLDGTTLYPIEREICKDIINANKIKTENDLRTKKEKIIFPYVTSNGKVNIIPQIEFKNKYPMALEYLMTKRELLSKRDKGKSKYEEWYAFGRRQSLDINSFKLFFPHICERPNFVISRDKNLLFYNGIAVINNDIEELLILQRILESDVFYKYIKATTKDYASGYLSMSKNHLKNFGVYQLNKNEQKALLNSNDSNLFVSGLYNFRDFKDCY